MSSSDAAFRKAVEIRLGLIAGWRGELTDEQVRPYIEEGRSVERAASLLFAEMMDDNPMTEKYARDA